MSDAEWQQKCVDALLVSLALGGQAGQQNWSDQRQGWITGNRPRVTLRDIDLSGQDLRGYDLSRCWVGNARFASANLSGVDFSQSIFRGCDFTGANLTGTSFYLADLHHPENMLVRTSFDDRTNMEVNRGMLAPQMDEALVDMAQASWRRADWRKRRSRSIVYKALSYVTDYGFGLRRAASVAAAIIIVFAVLFRLFDSSKSVTESGMISVRYFLGLSDEYATSSTSLSLLGTTEAVFGFVFLALLIAIFTRKFTDL